MKRICLALLLVVVGLSVSGVARAGSAYAVGDVFLDGGSYVNEYTATGTLVQSFGSATLTAYTTGMAFQNDGSLLVTGFSSGNVVQFDNSGNLKNPTWATGISLPESIAIDSTGHVYVSSVGGTGITEYNSTGGAAIGTSIVGTRTDWLDLAADQHTMLYSQETGQVSSVNVSTNTPNPNVASGLSGGVAAFRIIATGTYAGDILVSNESTGNPELLSSTGTVLRTYTGAGLGLDFALNLDPNGTDFWTADTSGNVAEFNIATGALDNHWSDGFTTYGLVVFGQQTASGGGGGTGGTSVPEPGSLSLLACGFVALGGLTKRMRHA